jgi:hypothetical protein
MKIRTLRLGFVMIVVLRNMLQMEAIVPFTFLYIKLGCTFYFNFATIDTWFLDLDRDILLTESSERSIW